MSFAVASDETGETIRRYGVWDEGNETAWPALFFVDRGRVAWRDITDDYRARISVNEVLERISDALR